ncbi:MAG: NAD(P)H-hydrate dehydratase [Chitinophagaceae bacterium]
MKILNAQQAKAWDEFTIQQEPVSSIDLMERAAQKCAEWILTKKLRNNHFTIFCGKGNNGGDGLAIARLLLKKGLRVTVYILEFGKLGTADFQTNLQRLHELFFTDIHFIQDKEHFPQLNTSNVIVDALFGNGINSPLTGLNAEVVTHINHSGCTIVSIDLPSGLFIDKSSIGNIVVEADHTLTFQCYKLGLLVAENAKYIGEVHVLDIGLHPHFLETQSSAYELIDERIIKQIFKPRQRFTHKGNFGHAALITGSIGLMGAATLCAAACMRTGAGKLTCYVPQTGYEIMQIAVPEAMAKIGGENFVSAIDDDLQKFDAVGIGPGLGLYDKHENFLQKLFSSYHKPFVIDADALNILSRHVYLLKNISHESVITPHSVEFDRLFGKTTNDFARIELAKHRSQEYNIYIILKGHHSVIAAPDGKCYINNTGNAGMATGGSGDVLTGIITSLLAQGYKPVDAAILGVYLHGLAGDYAAEKLSQEAMVAGDIVEYLPKAFQTFYER